jgi:hypothetical protein
VKRSFQRFEIQEEYILDRFHLERAARQTLGRSQNTRQMMNTLYRQGVGEIEQELAQRIARAEGRSQKELKKFYHYLQNNQDGLVDLKYRNLPNADRVWNLGAIEGNVDKLVVHRMKGRGCSWRISGAQAMLALCRHKEELKEHAYQYLPLEDLNRVNHPRMGDSTRMHRVGIPIFRGPDQSLPWVRQLKRSLESRLSLFG